MIRIKKPTVLIFVLLTLGFAISCQKDSIRISEDSKKIELDTPFQVVTAFFKASNSPEFTNSLERPYPDRFTECLLETILECANTRQKLQQPKSKSNNGLPNFEISKENEISLIITNFSKKISDKSITLKRKINEWIKNDEARIRVEVEIDGISEVKDFLLFKESSWQIFEIANENEHIYFATPDKNELRVQVTTNVKSAMHTFYQRALV